MAGSDDDPLAIKKRREIIREFCQSHGAPSGDWLNRLTQEGQKECIRQWIIKARSPEIVRLMPEVAKRLYDAHAGSDPFFYEAATAEELEERFDRWRENASEDLEKEIRYGGIEIEDFDGPRPWAQYDKYREECDKQWRKLNMKSLLPRMEATVAPVLNRRHKLALFLTLVFSGVAFLSNSLSSGFGILALGVALTCVIGSQTVLAALRSTPRSILAVLRNRFLRGVAVWVLMGWIGFLFSEHLRSPWGKPIGGALGLAGFVSFWRIWSDRI